jgi:DNA-directed RNA polymerase delta subunit
MAPMQQQIEQILKEAKSEMTMSELVNRVEKFQTTTDVEVRAAVLPMISGERVELTADRKLRLRA